jgi:hypothetical protein
LLMEWSGKFERKSDGIFLTFKVPRNRFRQPV